ADALLLAGVGPREDHLQRDGAVQPELPRLVDDAHAAPAQLVEDLVAGDVDGGGGGGLLRLPRGHGVPPPGGRDADPLLARRAGDRAAQLQVLRLDELSAAGAREGEHNGLLAGGRQWSRSRPWIQ